MDHRMIMFFLLAAKSSHIDLAAKKFGVDKSTVDRNLKKMSSLVNIELYKPGRNRIELTEGGHIVYSMCLPLIAIFNRLLSLQNGQTVSIGSTDDRNTQMLIDLIQNFKETRPEIYTEFYTGSRKELIHRLRDEALDFMVCSEFEFTDKSFEIFDFHVDYKLAVPVSHPLASRPYLTPDELKGLSLIIPACYNEISEWTGDVNVRSANRTNNFFTAILLMYRGTGCAFIPDQYPSCLDLNLFKLMPLYPRLTTNIKIVARKNMHRNSVAFEFKEYLGTVADIVR